VPWRICQLLVNTIRKWFVRKACSGDPNRMAEFRRELEAGAVVIDAESTPVEARST
jgi:hypothetical protein